MQGHTHYDWRVVTKWLQLNGLDWKQGVATEGLQLKGCNQSLGTEGLGLKCCNWRLPTTCDWRVGAKWFPTKGCNRPVETEVLQRKAWDWRPETEVLQLKTSNWMLVSEGTPKWQLKFCYWRGLGLNVKSWDWRLSVGTEDLGLRSRT